MSCLIVWWWVQLVRCEVMLVERCRVTECGVVVMLCGVRCVGMGMQGRGEGLGKLGRSRHVPLGSRGRVSSGPGSS